MTMTESQRLKAMANELMVAAEHATEAAEALDRYRKILKKTDPIESFMAGYAYVNVETMKRIAEDLVSDVADMKEDPRLQERPFRKEKEYRWTP